LPATKGALPFGLGAGYRYDKMYSNEVPVPVAEVEAKEFKTSEKVCELLAEVLPIEISDTVYKCKIDSGGGDESIVLGDKETYNKQMKNKREFYSCTSSNEKIKKLKLKIIKVGFMDSKTNKIYTN